MSSLSAASAQEDLDNLIRQVNEGSEPLTITTPDGNAVLVGEDDWRAVQETLPLSSIKGLTESILVARAEPLDEGAEELDW